MFRKRAQRVQWTASELLGHNANYVVTEADVEAVMKHRKHHATRVGVQDPVRVISQRNDCYAFDGQPVPTPGRVNA